MIKEQLQERLELYLEAEKKILTGQSYRIGDRELVRADLSLVQDKIAELEAEIKALDLKFRRRKRVVFI